MAVQQGSSHAVIMFGFHFESKLLNTRPDEISGVKKEYSVDLAQYTVKGSKLLQH